MVKQQIIDHLTYDCGLRRDSASKAVNGIVDLFGKTLASGENIYLRGLGAFKVEDRQPRKARNIQTGEIIDVPARKVIKFVPANELKNKLNA